MRDEELAAIKTRADAATPGPWVTDLEGNVYADGPAHPVTAVRGRFTEHLMQDARFIARAREDVPALLAEVERLRAELDETAERCIRLMGEVSTLREEHARLRELREIVEQLRELLTQAKGDRP
jgi:hypothetical protein